MTRAGLPDDPRLPQLAHALDGEAMQGAFDAAMRGTGRRVAGCRIERAKYRPRRSCTVSYVLEIHDDEAIGARFERLAGRFCAAGEARARYARSPASRAMLLPELGLFAWFVPNDPKLAALVPLCAAVRGRRALSRGAAAALLGDAVPPERIAAELVGYAPESRACARFDVVARRGAAARRMYAKIDRECSGGRTHRLMQALRASRAQADGRLVTPRPLAWDPASGIHWQEAVAGVPLGPRAAAFAGRVGRVLAALHDSAVPGLRELGGDELLGRPHACARELAEVEPTWSPALARLTALLADRAPTARELPRGTLHGDLHPRNVVADGDMLALIDFDAAHRGPAVLDLGAWIADALFRALLAGAPLAPIQDAAARLLHAYRAAAGRDVPETAVAWAAARALLVERAHRCVANLKPGCFALVPALLALAQTIARRGLFDASLAAQ